VLRGERDTQKDGFCETNPTMCCLKRVRMMLWYRLLKLWHGEFSVGFVPPKMGSVRGESQGLDASFGAKTSFLGRPREGFILAIDQALENSDEGIVLVGDVDGVAGELGIRGDFLGLGA
jgi:hypothetical protein